MGEPRDMDGEPVGVGDIIAFSYGIPPIRVEATIFKRDGRLMISTPGHKPEESTLWEIKRHTSGFWLVKRKTYGPA